MTVQALALFTASSLAAAAATIYTVPTAPASTILSGGRVRFTNTDTATHAVTAYAVAVGGSAGAGNCFLNAEPIAPHTHMDVDLPVLGAGGFLQAFADTVSTVTILNLAGILIT